MNYRRRDDFKV